MVYDEYENEHELDRQERQQLSAERDDEQRRMLLAATFGDDEDDEDEEFFSDEPRDDTYDPEPEEEEEDEESEGPSVTEQDDPETQSPAERDAPLSLNQPPTMKIFKVEAEGDTLYIQATDQLGARRQLTNAVGPIPDSLLTWTEVGELPEGEEFIPDVPTFTHSDDSMPKRIGPGKRQIHPTKEEKAKGKSKSRVSKSGAPISLTNQTAKGSISLPGKRFREVVYMCCIDPSGHSAIHHECPFCVVSCVIIHEREYRPLQFLCDQITDELVPKRYQKDFEFHARDLFPRNSKYTGWHQEDRHKVMEAGLKIVADLELPVRYCLVDKSRHKMKYKNRAYDPMEWAFTVCLEQVEKWFISDEPDDLGMVVTDHCSNRREEDRLTEIHQKYLHGNFPFAKISAEHLMDILSFGDSKHSRGLQMSDLCSYVINRNCQKKGDMKAMYGIIQKQTEGRRLPRGACGPFSCI